MVTSRLLGAVGIVAVVGVVLMAQTPAKPLAFETASVKPNNSGDPASSSIVQPGGRYAATNATLGMLMQTAYYAAPSPSVQVIASYGLHDDQIVGGPSWIYSERFDVVAKAVGNPPMSAFRDQARLMLRAVLADRFKLTLHHETRELPIYTLVIVRRDGKVGPQLRQSDAADCAAATKALDPAASTGPDPNAPPPCGAGFSRQGYMAARAVIFSTFLTGLSSWTDRVVFDRTALTGSFDWDLQWRSEPLTADLPGAASDRPSAAGVSLFTALQEQLGLKLESTKGPVDVLVIDHVEHPTED